MVVQEIGRKLAQEEPLTAEEARQLFRGTLSIMACALALMATIYADADPRIALAMTEKELKPLEDMHEAFKAHGGVFQP